MQRGQTFSFRAARNVNDLFLNRHFVVVNLTEQKRCPRVKPFSCAVNNGRHIQNSDFEWKGEKGVSARLD